MSLNAFISNIVGNNGLAKPNRFSVVINLPTSLGLNWTYSETLSMQCEAAELPGRTLLTADAKIYGPIYKQPYQTQYNDITLTFLCTSSFYERKLFEAWVNFIMPDSSNNLRFGDTYKTDIQISQYDDASAPLHNVDYPYTNTYAGASGSVYEATLIDAFPIGIAPQSLNWTDDGFHRLSVQFSYYRYKETVRQVGFTRPPARIV
jgi:hypothetical protein